MNVTKTERGFAIVKFTDLYGVECSIQKSSLATDDAIWFGVNDANPKILASKANELGITTSENTGWISYPIPEDALLTTRMHLNRESVAALLPMLTRFVETGELSED